MERLIMDKSKLGRLANMSFEITHDELRGTPFYVKRKTITNQQLSNKPAYRAFKLMRRLAINHEIADYEAYFDWVQKPLDDFDEQFPAVKRFRNTYGKFTAQRYLLTVKNSIELFIATNE